MLRFDSYNYIIRTICDFRAEESLSDPLIYRTADHNNFTKIINLFCKLLFFF